MRRYHEIDCETVNCLEPLSEECQLVVNGGCNSNSGSTIGDCIGEFIRDLIQQNPGAFAGAP